MSEKQRLAMERERNATGRMADRPDYIVAFIGAPAPASASRRSVLGQQWQESDGDERRKEEDCEEGEEHHCLLFF